MIQVNRAALLCLGWTLGIVLFIQAALLALPRPASVLGRASADEGERWLSRCPSRFGRIRPRSGHMHLSLRKHDRHNRGFTAFEALIHILHSSFQIGPLLIYASAAWVVFSQTVGVDSIKHD